jgi:hypothetical protein
LPSSTHAANVSQVPIRILVPGSGSTVSSPIPLEALISSNSGALLRIELTGEKDRLLSRIVKQLDQEPWSQASVSMDVLFQTGTGAENGRLIVGLDDRFGRSIEINSVIITLSDQEKENLLPSTGCPQKLSILSPSDGQTVSGPSMHVDGLVDKDIAGEIKLQLIAENGKVLGQRLTSGRGEFDSEGYTSFSGKVPFSVTTDTPARLIVYVDSQTGSQKYYLTSVEVVLEP